MTFSIPVNEKLSLKMRDVEDAEEMFFVTDRNREYLRPWFPWLDRTQSADDTRKFFAGQLEKFAKKEAAEFSIIYDGKIIGSVGFNSLSVSNKKGELGAWIDEEYSGKGIMTECVRAVITYGFKEFNLNRIQIQCSTRNIKSRKIPERLGFTLEGTRRQAQIVNGITVDNLMFSLLREEWKF